MSALTITGDATTAVESDDLECFAGEDVRMSFTISEAITGWTLGWKIATRPGGDALVSKTTSSGITVTDAAAGEGYVSLSAANTSLAAGRYFWDLARTDSGEAAMLAYGELWIIANTTLGG